LDLVLIDTWVADRALLWQVYIQYSNVSRLW